MTSIPVFATLGGAFIGALAVFGAMAYQQRRIDRRDAAAARARACADLLTHCLTFAHRTSTLMVTAQLRSGPLEGFDVLLRLRKPVDPIELHDFLHADLAQIYRAWSAIWTSASPALVECGNAVVNACGEVLEAATSGPVGRRREAQVGRERLVAATRTLAAARRDFAALVRSETGRKPAALFSAQADTP